MKTKIDKIRSTMGADLLNLTNFTPDEKCNAIYNWKMNSSVNLNLSFVESVHDFYLKRGEVTSKQEAALDNIITKFNIDLDRWCT